MSVRRGLGQRNPREPCAAASGEGHAAPVLVAWQGSGPWQPPAAPQKGAIEPVAQVRRAQ